MSVDKINNNKNVNQSALPQASEPSSGIQSVMAYAFVLLVEAVNIQSQSSILKAKGMNFNGDAQIRLNNVAAALQFYDVPELKKEYKDVRHTHWHWQFWDRGFHYSTISKQTVRLNDPEIQAAQMKNQQQNKIRGGIENQLALLQQTAQTGGTQLNNEINRTVQTTQEAQAITQMLQTLTEKIFLNKK